MTTVVISSPLAQWFEIGLRDLLPIKGVAVFLPGEALPYRISEGLHRRIKEYAATHGVAVSDVLEHIRNELHGLDCAGAIQDAPPSSSGAH